jgi:hypothetical protein
MKPHLFLVDIFIEASLELSSEAIDCIFFKASKPAIIFSLPTNFALQASALYSLYLENFIAISDASIPKSICSNIFTAKYHKAQNLPSV